jgi:hypothetical protein
MTVAATDKSGDRYQLGLAVGDKVRLFDRVHDANTKGRDQVLANNGSIVEVLALDATGITIRNDEGVTGLVACAKLRAKADAPVRLTWGYATTLNLAQGITSTEHIHAALDGSKSMSAFAVYVAMSRHKTKAWMVLNEGAIRQQIASKTVEANDGTARASGTEAANRAERVHRHAHRSARKADDRDRPGFPAAGPAISAVASA